jgi:hypothetical protein
VIQPEVITAGIRFARAEESWIPVLFGGMIPIVGAGAIFWLIWHAVKEPPEDEEQKKEDGPEDPPS